MKKLGVIGGLGPMATAFFMKMVIEMTDAKTDQEHIEMVIYNCPQIPDRTNYILGKSDLNPTPEIIRLGKKLEAEGVDVIAIPCITANYFYEELTQGIGVPIINILDEVRHYLAQQKVTCAGIMATSGTIQSRLFQKALDGSCRLVRPSDEHQADVMHIIYENVKANKPVEKDRFERVSQSLREQGAEVILLGCTELSVVSEEFPLGPGYLDVMRLMARCAVERCAVLKDQYRDTL